MKNNKYISLVLRLMLFIITVFSSNHLFADGSKDLFPSGGRGYRTYLIVGPSTLSGVGYPFMAPGVHYVYAKAGERISLASSAVDFGSGTIRLYQPNGTQVTGLTFSATNGRIANRTDEVSGPRLSGVTTGAGYTATYYTVPAGGDGVYRVEFTAPGTGTITPRNAEAVNANWAAQTATNTYITAWDVSVINTTNTAFIKGRVFTNTLSFHNYANNGSAANSDWAGTKTYFKLYTLTADGVVYSINFNGFMGIATQFWSNRFGMTTTPNGVVASYKSLPNITAASVQAAMKDPNTPEPIQAGYNNTNKLFYTLPANYALWDLPATATGAQFNHTNPQSQTMWLKSVKQNLNISNIRIMGYEGTPGLISNNGGWILFDAMGGAEYKVTLVFAANQERVFTGTTDASGTTKIFWDRKDGAGVLVTNTANLSAKVELKAGEVHFPFVDMEYNNGIIYNRLNDNFVADGADADLVYWNDSDIANVTNGSNVSPKNNSHIVGGTAPNISNGLGQHSTSNGHSYAVGATGYSGQFGDNAMLDTWAFVRNEAENTFAPVPIKTSDLQAYIYILNLMGSPGRGRLNGDTFKYDVWFSNHGPDAIAVTDEATLMIEVPNGVRITNITNNAGITMTWDPVLRRYTGKKSNWGVTNGSTNRIEFVLDAVVDYTATNATSAAGSFAPVVRTLIASVLRPADYIDPAATNSIANTPPTDIYDEIALNTVPAVTYNGVGQWIYSTNMDKADIIVLLDCMNDFTTGADGELVSEIIYYENFNTSSKAVNDGRKAWLNQPYSIAGYQWPYQLYSSSNGGAGAITNGYRFSPGYHDPLYNASLTGTHTPTSVGAVPSGPIKYFDSQIGDGSYAVLPPAFTRLGWDPLSFTDPTTYNGAPIGMHWAPGQSYPNVYDWTNTYPWNNPTDPAILNTLDMSGHLNGAAFLVKGNVTQSQGIRPFYRIDDVKPQVGKTYTLQLFSFVNYTANANYMYMDLVDRNTGQVYATAQLKADNPLPGPGVVSFGWVPMKAAFKNTIDFTGKTMDIQIRGKRVYGFGCL